MQNGIAFWYSFNQHVMLKLWQGLEKRSGNGLENKLKERLIISAIPSQTVLNRNLKSKITNRQKRNIGFVDFDDVENRIRQKRDLSVSFVGSKDVAFENDIMKMTGDNYFEIWKIKSRLFCIKMFKIEIKPNFIRFMIVAMDIKLI